MTLPRSTLSVSTGLASRDRLSIGAAVASASVDFPPAPCAIRASLSLRLGFSAWVGRELVLDSVELGVSFSGTGGEMRLTGMTDAGDACSERGSDGKGGVPPSCEISMRGFAGTLDREPDVALDAALPGRGGRTSEARGASSESSEDESELESE